MQLLKHRMPTFDLPSSFHVTWNSQEPWNPIYCSLFPCVPIRTHPAALRQLYSTCMQSTALKPSKILDTGTSKNPVLIFRYFPGGDQVLLMATSKFTAGSKHVKFSLCCPKWGGSARLILISNAPLKVRLWKHNRPGKNTESKWKAYKPKISNQEKAALLRPL